MIPPDLVAQVDQHSARIGEMLDALVEHQREFVAEQGADNSIFVCGLASMLTERLCHGHCADMLALAARRLAASQTPSPPR